jgi:hypothetical protein
MLGGKEKKGKKEMQDGHSVVVEVGAKRRERCEACLPRKSTKLSLYGTVRGLANE